MNRPVLPAVLWWLGDLLLALAWRLSPRPAVRRFEADGAMVRPIAEAPREEVFAPPAEWWPLLTKTHTPAEIRSPWVRA